MPSVGLFIPCYVDQFYPRVGLATVELLERFGCQVEFPEAQTCCGQPMANTGCADLVAPIARRFVEIFAPYDYVVCPSGSCVSMVRNHYGEYFDHDPTFERLRPRVMELCEFLTEVLGIERVEGRFPHRVGLHQSCHGLRELRLASSSEIVGPAHNRTRRLLESLEGIELSELKRPDECCGFGGTFAVAEEAVSCMMGLDRIADHEQAGTEVLTGNDMSCLMHLEGLLRRQHKPIRVMHVAEILQSAMLAGAAT
ncbi:MAG TPA: (Fe-S)-binding protein [Pirellulales bacterium]|jgi:L-lactate dehydrogenase complex protein LldE|nr:(Fe-S)-binding protein [Pirellulales bacterium]